ncbi:hypothetical protein C2S51_023638 [Perilla frutescens var. frutescens]|nr:hypothetical protein C2S51_023638 [Perilla frutescens var. frutescens]
MIMPHGDHKDLVLPPKVVSVQVVVILVPYKDSDTKGIFGACADIVKSLNESGIMSKLILEIIIHQVEVFSLGNESHYDNSSKYDIPMAHLFGRVKYMLNDIQSSFFDVAKEKRNACIQIKHTWAICRRK